MTTFFNSHQSNFKFYPYLIDQQNHRNTSFKNTLIWTVHAIYLTICKKIFILDLMLWCWNGKLSFLSHSQKAKCLPHGSTSCIHEFGQKRVGIHDWTQKWEGQWWMTQMTRGPSKHGNIWSECSLILTKLSFLTSQRPTARRYETRWPFTTHTCKSF